jgi:heptaprenyl diphosphate synthase
MYKEGYNLGKTKKVVIIGLLVAIGLVLHILESNIRIPIYSPGFKVGFANIVSLISIVIFGPVEAFFVAITRSVLGGFLGGNISSVIFSLNGAIVSTLIMWITYKFFYPKIFSLIGISVLGAAAHNFAQVLTSVLILSNTGIFSYLPMLLLVGTVTGILIGITSNYTLKYIKRDKICKRC